MIFVGVDWAEAHHDVCVLDGEGNVLGRRRIADSFAGVSELHALMAEHLGDDDYAGQVVVGIEKDRGLIVTALVAANYQIYGINPVAAARYRDRHHVSGAKSDHVDAGDVRRSRSGYDARREHAGGRRLAGAVGSE